MPRLLQSAIFLSLLLLCVSQAAAQQVFTSTRYQFEAAMITEPPELGSVEIEYPDAARKNGVEGTVKVSATLGEDGRVRDIAIVNDLGHGTGEAVVAGLQRFTFKPAKLHGKPAAMKFSIDYEVSLYYDEGHKDVAKPKLVTKPAAAYPASQRGDAMKGKVSVVMLLKANGQVEVLNVSSVMHQDFDKAAKEAALGLKFTPAVHKKSKQPVSQVMSVEFDFKP